MVKLRHGDARCTLCRIKGRVEDVDCIDTLLWSTVLEVAAELEGAAAQKDPYLEDVARDSKAGSQYV
jgi:hypothetical protein